ncbi:WASH complex subunit 3 [Ataeniobius toweri]|uniref:WASH complex subunit 3 n=1 Tax=Ataeniobius toweri TaxID=208326 RepID=A0ABU7A157_9TELE|nr:WASH complex subunit 3 [Ataeniobius toweri]
MACTCIALYQVRGPHSALHYNQTSTHSYTHVYDPNCPSQPDQSLPETAPALEKAEAVLENIMTVVKDPRYARYLKMVQVGVPVMAIRNKMIMEGLDPNLLDTPDAPVPDGAASSTENEDVPATSSDSESSFSD